MQTELNQSATAPKLSGLQHATIERFSAKMPKEDQTVFPAFLTNRQSRCFLSGSPYQVLGSKSSQNADNAQDRNFPRHTVSATWYLSALKELDELDAEIAEEGLPEITADMKKEARSIIEKLRNQPLAPVIYSTEEGEIVIQFKSPVKSSMIAIELDNRGEGACFCYTNGKNRYARYQDCSELPDGFVREQLQLLNESEAL